MDRAKFEARLIQAEKRVILSEQHIARQREFVLSLERLGNNADAARALLEQFEKIQAIQVERRDGLVREIGKLLADRTPIIYRRAAR
jgi:hypothetical protein